MDNLLTLEQFNNETINEGSEKKIRSFYISQKHDGLEIDDAVNITARKFKKSEAEIRKMCADVLDEKKNN